MKIKIKVWNDGWTKDLVGQILEVTRETKTHYGINGFYIPKSSCEIVETNSLDISEYDLPEIVGGFSNDNYKKYG